MSIKKHKYNYSFTSGIEEGCPIWHLCHTKKFDENEWRKMLSEAIIDNGIVYRSCITSELVVEAFPGDVACFLCEKYGFEELGSEHRPIHLEEFGSLFLDKIKFIEK